LAASLLGTTALAHALFFGEDRYHMVASPALVLLACAAFRKSERTKFRPGANGELSARSD
jgi:hypothetical protein